MSLRFSKFMCLSSAPHGMRACASQRLFVDACCSIQRVLRRFFSNANVSMRSLFAQVPPPKSVFAYTSCAWSVVPHPLGADALP